MRFGVVLPHFRAVASPAAIRDVAQAAERLGYDSVWVTDRAAVPRGEVAARFGPPFYDPYVVLSHVAALTSRVRLGTSVLVLPFRHPVIAARALASLDQLCGGRLDVGVGAGWMPEEFAATGVPFERRGRLTDEYIAALIALWTQPVASFSGETVHFANLVSEPRPAQTPHPPILVGGSTEAAVERTVRHGQGWHGSPAPLTELRRVMEALHRACAAAGRDPATLALSTRAPLRLDLNRPSFRPDGDDGDAYPTGTPDRVALAIHRYAAAGFGEIVFDTFFAHPALDDSADPAAILRALETFARTVMPAFRRGSRE